MNKEELLYEQKHCKRFYRVILDGNFEDFYEFPKAIKYAEKKWKDDSFHLVIRKYAEITKGAYKGK